jgi:hypothetical protein
VCCPLQIFKSAKVMGKLANPRALQGVQLLCICIQSNTPFPQMDGMYPGDLEKHVIIPGPSVQILGYVLQVLSLPDNILCKPWAIISYRKAEIPFNY